MDSEIITLIFSGVVTLSTIVYVILTGTLVAETKKMRKNNVQPYLVAYLDITETNARIAFLKIKNIGNGVALNVKFKILKELDYPTARALSDKTYFQEGVNYFPPDHMDKHLLISFESEYNASQNDYVEFEVEYESILSEKNKHTYKLRLNELIGQSILTPPDTHIGQISYRLKRIEELLEKYWKNSKSEK